MRTLEAKIGVALVLSLAALASGRPARGAPPQNEGEYDPKGAFAKLEARLPGLDEEKRRLFLRDLVTAAFDAGETAKATQFANELLSPPPSATHAWARGNELHVGHLVLGRLALRAGNVAAAKQHLLESAQTGSPMLYTFGPNMLLAKDLLERGERKAVVDHFLLWAKVWRSGRARGVLTEWTQAVQRGAIPDFRAHLTYHWYHPRFRTALDPREPPGGRELTDGERRVLDEVEARAKEAARKDLLAIYLELKGAPAGARTPDELLLDVVGMIPPDELARAQRDTRSDVALRPTTAAQRYAVLRDGIFQEVVAQLRGRIPRERITAVLRAFVESNRRSDGARSEK